jgi:demethylmenaquinone methyltransferase/2-methoxy-6-polyprenyl-1,4-benzoquinol methylase
MATDIRQINDLIGDNDSYVQKLLITNPLGEPVLEEIIKSLHLPRGSSGLDAGCGIGLQMLLLAEATAPNGRVTGLDISQKFLNHAEKIAQKAGILKRVSFKRGDVNNQPFDDNTFDWLWSAHCAGYPTGNPGKLMKELARVVKPGGLVAILAYSSQMLLPGYPMLEARLNATPTGIAPFARNMKPRLHFLRALGWFQQAGLDNLSVRTFVPCFHAPLSDEIRNGLISLLEMRWGAAKSEVTEDDWQAFQRLSLPDSPDFILDRPDYYAFFTYTVFSGRVPE